ncbi:MAG: undecaprenyl-diphosphate phosphatase [archaeon GB-1867-005]|nr:undecaprenyl-diphosphate phosphatase [Candidatus Culexmicrobium cathedralense]
MRSIAIIIIIGAIQGLIEWIPISSSGQIIVLLAQIIGANPSTAYDYSLALHLGTALSALVAYRHKIYRTLKSMPRKIKSKEHVALLLTLTPSCSFLIGIPIYLILKIQLSKISANEVNALIGLALIATGLISYKSKKNSKFKEISNFKVKEAILLGAAQGLSVIPGISRSAITIALLLILGFKSEDAFEASFIAAIPVTFAAGLAEIFRAPSLSILAGIFSAFACGLIAMNFMLMISRKVKFHKLLIMLGLIMIASYTFALIQKI